MKLRKHNILIAFLLSVGVTFSQVQTQKSNELFNVNNDVIVEINSHDSDIKVEFWNKKSVAVETILVVEDVTKAEADELFKNWTIEALGNSNKIIINSKPVFHDGLVEIPDLHMSPPIMDAVLHEIEMDFEPVIAYALKFDSVSFPSPPQMPHLMIEHLGKVEWDQAAYEKDKEKYLEEFKLKQEKWAQEMEEKIAPQMAAYEKEMEKWSKEFEKEYQPQMEAYQQEMEKWQQDFEKNMAPKLALHQKEMSAWQQKFETEMAPKLKIHEEKMTEMQHEIEKQHAKSLLIKKNILIKIPKNVGVKLNIQSGSIQLPEGIKKI